MATHFKTYDQVGKKEDISDVISNIAPTATPFQSLIGQESVSNTVYQWQEDDLAAVAANAAVEGADGTDADLTATTMRSNYTQIMAKTIKVSATADAVSTYGRAKETAYQLSKKSAELKREFEYALVGSARNAAAGSTSVARQFGNVWGQDASSNAIINSAVITNNAVAAALTEAMVLSTNQKLYEAGGEASYIMVKPADSLIIAGFAAASGRTRDFDTGTKVVNVVDLYVSPFGTQKVVLNRFMKADSALLFDPANWKKAVLRPFSRTLLAKTGDADRHFIVGEFGLKHVNYKASGAITGLTGTNPMLP
jgi:Family of unknown function (DUF5309)